MGRIAPQDDVDVLGLTSRSRNALRQVGVDTIAELLEMSDWSLKITPNLGPVSRADIEAALKRHGLSRTG